MPGIPIDVPSGADLARVVTALCDLYGYQSLISDGAGGQIANPETRGQFAKKQVAIWIKSRVADYEVGLASETARLAAIASANNLNVT